MITANYHTHTPRCHHAHGSEREYIENAIKGGFKELGFSDHSPYIFPDGYYSSFRMTCREAVGYFDVLTALQKEYADDIKLYIGFEIEYYPDYFESIMRFFEDFPLDYLILGQHFLENEMTGICSGQPDNDGRVLKMYVSQVCEALKTGCFSYLAHPDVPRFLGDEAVYNEQMAKLCAVAKETDTPLEINLLGLRTKRNYPSRKFFEIAAGVGNEIIIGSDAHTPETVCDIESTKTAEDMISELNLNGIGRLKFHRPVLR